MKRRYGFALWCFASDLLFAPVLILIYGCLFWASTVRVSYDDLRRALRHS
jgi:hypothetical protein